MQNRHFQTLNNSLDAYYLRDLNKASPSEFFTSDELNELIDKYQKTKDLKLRDKIALSFVKLVILVARRHQNKTLPLHDLISEGMLGLYSAIDHFNSSNGTKFITFAYIVIGRYIREAIEYSENIVKLPKNIRNDKRKTMTFFRHTNINPNDISSIPKHELPSFVRTFIDAPGLYSKITINVKMADDLPRDDDLTALLDEDNTVQTDD
jgi:RNA polymerase sigma factor (sigma-70 family)